ncbi:MAG: FHA domain-containing protein [Armatimonadetes bacterium]|nr:FHA domain-containing protein [Armatimonadota bacterium]
MRRRVAALLLGAVVASSSAQTPRTVEFQPQEGARLKAWVASELPSSAPESASVLEAPKFSFALQDAKPEDRLLVWDEISGNAHSLAVKELKSPWPLKPESFGFAAKVEVRVEYKGRPVETAQVEIDDGGREQTQLIDSSSKGIAEFWFVRLGEAKVTVRYRSEGAEADPSVHRFEVLRERKDAVPALVCSLPNPTQVIGSEGALDANGRTGPAPAGELRVNPWGNAAAFLIALALAVAVGYGLYRWLQKNRDTVEKKLSDLGVEIPGKPEDDPAPTLEPIRPQPPPKIELADAEPTPAPSSASSQGPARLIDSSGDAFALEASKVVVGRDAGVDLMIAEESSVSRRHAEIRVEGGRVFVQDLSSTNGTFVNGVRVAQEVELKPGDELLFGAAKFRFKR